MSMKSANQQQFKNFSQNLIHIRTYYGLSKVRMAQLLGIGVGTLNKLEQGKIPPRLTIDILFFVQKEFHISPAQLLSGVLEQFDCHRNGR